MKRFLIFLVVLAIAVAILGYWRGWYSVTKDGNDHVQVDQGKFQDDKAAFSKTVKDKTKAMKEKVAGLWAKTEGMSGDDKTQAQKELRELQAKHDRIEGQLKAIDEVSSDKFESLKADLAKELTEVDKKIDELAKKLDKTKDR